MKISHIYLAISADDAIERVASLIEALDRLAIQQTALVASNWNPRNSFVSIAAQSTNGHDSSKVRTAARLRRLAVRSAQNSQRIPTAGSIGIQ